MSQMAAVQYSGSAVEYSTVQYRVQVLARIFALMPGPGPAQSTGGNKRQTLSAGDSISLYTYP